jgi:sigma-E factor negative regulatory protein RseC
MIEEQAQVIEVKGDQLVLQAQTQSACGSCSAKNGCGTSLLSKVIGRKFTRFQVDNNVNAMVGDTVVVGIPEEALLKGSLAMYILPIIGMLVFALLSDVILSDDILTISAQSRDLMIAVSAIIGLVLGSFMSKWYFQRKSSTQFFSPVILRKIIDHGKL